MKNKTKGTNWPEVLYMQKEVDGKNYWFSAYEGKDISMLDDGEVVGVYRFEKLQKVSNIVDLTDV